MEHAVQRLVLRTSRSPLRHLWRGVYAIVAHGVAILVTPRGGTAYVAGSVAAGEPVYGLSDIDLVVVAPDALGARSAARRGSLVRGLPVLRRLIPHLWTYSERELRSVTTTSGLLHGVAEGRAVFLGPDAPGDTMGLLDRPGLAPPAEEWRRLRGFWTAPESSRRPDEKRLVAWLELQYRWRWAFLVVADPPGVRPASQMSALVAAAARVWLYLAHDQHLSGGRAPLARAAHLLPDERSSLELALRLRDEIRESPPFAVTELWACFARLTARTGDHLSAELEVADRTLVGLAGRTDGGAGLPLLDWRGLAVPRVRSASDGSSPAVEDRFHLEPGNPADPAAVACAAARTSGGRRVTLRSGELLVRPTSEVWTAGRMRGLEIPDSDPVSFALLARQSAAAFPDVPGWSISDRARRAVAEHRGWLAVGDDRPARGPRWVGRVPHPAAAGPASLGFLMSAARAALLLESLERGIPRLPLDFEAVVDALSDRGAAAEEAGRGALTALRAFTDSGHAPTSEHVHRLLGVVRGLPAYAHVGSKPQHALIDPSRASRRSARPTPSDR